MNTPINNQESVKLPSDLQKTVDSVRERMTIEEKKIKGLIKDQKVLVNDIVTKERYLGDLENRAKLLEKEVESKEKEWKEADDRKTELGNACAELSAKKEKLEKDIAENSKNLEITSEKSEKIIKEAEEVKNKTIKEAKEAEDKKRKIIEFYDNFNDLVKKYE